MAKPEECMNDEELAATRRRRLDARASLACEGIHLTPDEESLFAEMDARRLTHDQREAFVLDYIARILKKKTP
jgi:hypothetical protein